VEGLAEVADELMLEALLEVLVPDVLLLEGLVVVPPNLVQFDLELVVTMVLSLLTLQPFWP